MFQFFLFVRGIHLLTHGSPTAIFEAFVASISQGDGAYPSRVTHNLLNSSVLIVSQIDFRNLFKSLAFCFLSTNIIIAMCLKSFRAFIRNHYSYRSFFQRANKKWSQTSIHLRLQLELLYNSSRAVLPAL